MMMRVVFVGLLTAGLFISTTSCKGYREFKEARKELKTEKEQRAEAPEETAEAPTQNGRNHFADSLAFGLQKTVCFGRCPTYEFRIFESGYATYTGTANVERIGNFTGYVDASLIESLRTKAQDIGIMMMLDEYNNNLITDLPAVIFQVQIGGQKKMVYCRIQCPERLIDFGSHAETLIEQIEWKPVVED